jgi:hypothetical protein
MLFNSCSGQNNKVKKPLIKRIHIAVNMVNSVYDGKGYFNNIDFYINYYKNYSIYEIPYHQQYQLNDKLLYDSVKYNYIIFNNSTKSGYFLKSSTDSFTNRINADSMIQEKMFHGYDFYTAIKNKDSAAIMSHHTTASKFVNKEVVKYRLPNNPFSDSIIYCYDKSYNDIPFSFSPYLDSVYGKKLQKIEIFQKYDPKETPVDLRIYYKNHFTIIKMPAVDKSDMVDLFEKFIKTESKTNE